MPESASDRLRRVACMQDTCKACGLNSEKANFHEQIRWMEFAALVECCAPVLVPLRPKRRRLWQEALEKCFNPNSDPLLCCSLPVSLQHSLRISLLAELFISAGWFDRHSLIETTYYVGFGACRFDDERG